MPHYSSLHSNSLYLFNVAGGASAAKSSSGFRIVVAGDPGTGKSSLISIAAAGSVPSSFSDPPLFPVLPNVPPVLPPTRLPEDMFDYNVPITAIDTSSSLEDRDKLADELKGADAIVLTYGCDTTRHGLITFWLPYLQRLDVKVPVILAGCKLDLRQPLLLGMSPIARQFPLVENYIECSTSDPILISIVFRHAQKAVLHPSAPLFDRKTQTLKPRCLRALIRIFILYDQDGDGTLSDGEFNDLMVKCLNVPYTPACMVVIKIMVREKFPGGVNENRLTLAGFIYLLAYYIKCSHPQTTWNILRTFGYNNDIRFYYHRLPCSIKLTPDQSLELTSEAIEFLKRVFSSFDIDGDGAFDAHELEFFFCATPDSPWSEPPFAEVKALGGLSLNGFLSKWALMTLLNPMLSVENIMDIGYVGEPSSAFKVIRRRRVDHKKQQSDKNVFLCFVFGPKEAGKSSLMHSFVGRPFSQVYTPTIKERYAVNIVDPPGETRKTLILREIPEDAIGKLLIHKDALAACDIAVFVYDSSNGSSWTKATELLFQVANHAKSTGYEVPCLIVAAKEDLDPDPTARQESRRVSHDMGIEAPIPISARVGDFNDVYRRIMRAAEHPHLSIPKTRKQYCHYYRLLNGFIVSVAIVWLVYVAVAIIVDILYWYLFI